MIGWGGAPRTVALAAAAAALLVLLPMLLVSLPAADPYEQESRRMFVEWKAKCRKSYTYAGEEECRYAVFKERLRRIAWAKGSVISSGLNGFSATTVEEFKFYHGYLRHGARVRDKKMYEQEQYEQETRWMFVGWKAKYGKTYRDVGEEKCRYMLFMGNRRVVARLNATAGGQNMYGLNQFGDLTNEEVQQRCYPEMEDPELSAKCQAAVPDPGGSDTVHERLIWYQVCRCIATE